MEAHFCGRFTINQYHSHNEMLTVLKCLKKAHPAIVQLKTIGFSVEKRPLTLIIIRNSSNHNSTSNKGIWLDGGMHAREWISPAVVLVIV